MLVLTRRIGEEILIGGNIRLKVLAFKRNQVRLGIAAPSSVHVARLELLAEGHEDEGGALGCPALQALDQNCQPR
jgi:carbon storage regulator CsrA